MATPTSGTVTVACKLPHGLVLRLFRMEEASEPVMGGGSRTVQKAVETSQRVTLKGFAVAIDRAPQHMITGGYGLTHNIDAGFFAKWLEQNADHDAVVNNLIFAQPKEESARSQAKEQKELKSGLEPIDRNRLPKKIADAKEA